MITTLKAFFFYVLTRIFQVRGVTIEKHSGDPSTFHAAYNDFPRRIHVCVRIPEALFYQIYSWWEWKMVRTYLRGLGLSKTTVGYLLETIIPLTPMRRRQELHKLL
jgi:hypothetical protein